MKKSYFPTVIKKEEQEQELKLEESDSFFDKRSRVQENDYLLDFQGGL